jgi:hypothetical protein
MVEQQAAAGVLCGICVQWQAGKCPGYKLKTREDENRDSDASKRLGASCTLST